MDEVSGFVLRAVQREAQVLATLEDASADYQAQLLAMDRIKSVRIAKNHGLMMALADALRDTVALTEAQWAAAHAQIIAMALERQQAINADHPFVQQFWEYFDNINDRADHEHKLDHSRNPAYIAINLVDYERALGAARLSIPGGSMPELKRHLPGSRRRKLVDSNRTVNSFITGTSKRCWIFQRDPTATQ